MLGGVLFSLTKMQFLDKSAFEAWEFLAVGHLVYLTP